MPLDSFHFVDVTPGSTEQNAETRRRIRSQAMRDYRRRRKMEEELNSTSPEDSQSSLSIPRRSSMSQAGKGLGRRASSTQSLSVEPEPPSRQSSSTSKDELPAIETLQSAKGKRRSSQQVLQEDTRSSLQSRPERRSEPRAQIGTFSSFAINLPKPKKPSTVLAEDVDTLSSPGQLEQMLSICESYNRWLLSNTANEPSQMHASGPWDNPTSQMILLSLCLKSIGHMDALQQEQSPSNRRLFKTRVLALANKRLKNPAKALEDKTIGALACLTSYEISRGSIEAGLHLRGLAQIIKLRGGIDVIGQRGGLCMFLEILDLIHAVYFRCKPMYTFADRSTQSSSENIPHAYEFGDIDQALFDELGDFIVSIADLEDISETYAEPTHMPPLSPLISFESDVEHWYQRLTQAEQGLKSSYNSALAYVCGLAAGLHLATTSPISAHPTRLKAHNDELFTAMSNLPEDDWDTFQELHIRILLTSLSAARHISHKSWYNAHLAKRLYQVKGEDWTAVKRLMVSFLDMHAAARQPRKQSVRVMANGIEIVVDASEARMKGMAIQTAVVNEYTGP